SICFQIRIPNNRGYLSAFYGAIGQLGQWRTWALDDAHTAKEVAAVWRDIYFALDRSICATKESSGIEVEDMSRFRIDPDDCTIIQIECQPDQWEQFYPPKGCV